MHRDQPFSACAKFSEKLTFITSLISGVSNISFSPTRLLICKELEKENEDLTLRVIDK